MAACVYRMNEECHLKLEKLFIGKLADNQLLTREHISVLFDCICEGFSFVVERKWCLSVHFGDVLLFLSVELSLSHRTYKRSYRKPPNRQHQIICCVICIENFAHFVWIGKSLKMTILFSPFFVDLEKRFSCFYFSNYKLLCQWIYFSSGLLLFFFQFSKVTANCSFVIICTSIVCFFFAAMHWRD